MSNTTHEQMEPQIAVHPAKTLIDEPITIRLHGFRAHQHVTLRARMGQDWSSYATFLTDAHGVADVGRQRPLAGTCRLQLGGIIKRLSPEP